MRRADLFRGALAVGDGADGYEPPAMPDCEECHEPLPADAAVQERRRAYPTTGTVTIFYVIPCPRCGWEWNVQSWEDIEPDEPRCTDCGRRLGLCPETRPVAAEPSF